jgi:hypothetical protein
MNTQTYIARITHPKTLAGRLRTACTTTLLSLLLLLALPAVVQAQFNYVITNGTITITGYTGPGGAVTIPNMIGGLPVSGIGFEAFYGCTNLTSVTISASVTSIGAYVFDSCTDLATITVDTNNPAFSSMDGVLFDKNQTTLVECPEGRAGSYTVPDSVTYIEDSAFQECMELTAVRIGNSVTSIGDGAFTDCRSLTSATIPNSVTSIGDSAFSFCLSLTNITMPGSVTYMGDAAFQSCGLTSVTIGHSLTNIPDAAFAGCAKLTSVTIPNTVTSIGVEAFDGCSSLTNVTIPNSVTSLENGAFQYCPSLTSIMLPNSVTRIGDEAFYECANLTAIYCWGNAPTIGLDVFDWDNSATIFYLSGTTGWGPTLGGRPTVMWNPAGGVYIVRQPQGVATNVGATISFSVLASGTAPLSYQWWKDTSSLTGGTNIAFRIVNVQPADAGHYTVMVTDMGGSTTSQVAILDVYATPPGGLLYTPNANRTVTITGYTGHGGVIQIPDAINGLPVMAIGDQAFSQCASLTRIIMPDSVTSIGIGAFRGCTSLARVTLPSRLISIGGGAFSGCGGLDGVPLPNTVTSIGEGAFSNCSSLTRVTLPSRVTSIRNQTFWGCLSLSSVTIPDSVTNIGDLAFDSCWGLTSVTIPDSVTSIGESAFAGCTSLTNVTIPNSVTSIGESAFHYCTSLNRVTIPNNLTSIEGWAFSDCLSLARVYFQGNAPSLGADVFDYRNHVELLPPVVWDPATIYYLPGTTGWDVVSAVTGLPTVLWVLPNPLILNHSSSFGVKTNRFGFIISWAAHASVVVEASTNLANPTWSPVSTNTLTNGSSYFTDPQWTNYPARFYRLRSP